MSDGDKDTPAVLPYRVGQVEKQLVEFRKEHSEAFTRLELKLDSYVAGFVTQKQFDTALEHAESEHNMIMREISKCSTANQAEESHIVRRVSELEDWNKWATRIIFGTIFIAILAVVGLTAS